MALARQETIVRPWDAIKNKDERRKSNNSDSPLDALFNMASNFEALKAKSGKQKQKQKNKK